MRPLKTLAAALLPVLALTACGSQASPVKPAQGVDPGRDVVSQEKKVDAIAALLPPQVRAAGSIKVGASFGTPPSAYYPDPGSKKPAGLDIDLTDAVAKVLGLTVQREDAAFDTILPALGSGKYDVGTGNFGVTTARLQTIDFVTYIDDGQGFAVKKDDTALSAVTDLTQLCGLTIGTGSGTTFEATLNAKKQVCAAAGKKPYTVQSYSDNGAVLTGLQQGRIDVEMSTINGLRFQAAQPGSGTKFLGEYHRLDVGFAFKKGTPLAPAFQAAVNQLIKDGTYQRILDKWGTAGSAIAQSEVSPPEHA
ncbi:ABC transporter substrate-binding protein [Kitasatospora viridis]|uniref:Polar amino acid transport system substrate-binding protein n=1 Tax=Kitasatospora viridis TaxID=281105 RepID=A0A561UEW8_9ACTN|nr:ABC transporter substrate-binding protein [Kitasatospora viridis]TWF97929.1 polar amino acid transport system substrate-binding protein [Kitasatospora viridis]